MKKPYQPTGQPKVKFPKAANPMVRKAPRQPTIARVTDLRKFIK